MEKNDGETVLGCMVGIFGLFIFVCILGSLWDNKGFQYVPPQDYRSQCELAGGVDVKTNHGYQCLKVEKLK